MARFTRAGIALTLATAACQALAQSAEIPLEFKGVSIGQSATAVQSDTRFDCKVIRRSFADELCTLKSSRSETLAGAPALDFSVHIYDDTVHRIGVAFNQTAFEQVRAAAVERYGPPTASETKKLQNAAGAEFASSELKWVYPTGSVRLIQRLGRMDRSYYEIYSPASLSLFQARNKALGSVNAKDF